MTVGDVRHHSTYRSRFLGTHHDVLVYLPPGYDDTEDRRYPVLYLHDGQNVFDGETAFIRGQEWEVDESAERLIRARAMQPVIIVAVHNAGDARIDEYTPSPDPGLSRGGNAINYGRFLVEELKPFIDREYRTWRAARNTGLGGSSLGGLVSLFLWNEYPHVFGRLAIMSPSLWWDRRVILRTLEQSNHPQRPKIWLDVGTCESDSPEVSVRDARLLKELLLRKGWREGHDLRYLEAQGDGHNELAWARRVPPMLRFLFPLPTR